MKRFGNLYSQIYDMDNLKLAHKNARKGKGWYEEVKEVDSNTEHYLEKLQSMLKRHDYHTSEYEQFTKKERNKERIIYKLPYFPDRICQWAIMQVIEPFLMRTMVTHTYSAIPGRGIHKALRDVKNAMWNDISNCQYCFKFDIKKYYSSINHEILKWKFRRLFKDAELLYILDEIIDSIATAKVENMLDIWLMSEDYDETGIPIGNYLSQYCGNFYLSEFDHWMKEVKHIKFYYRYMDDICIFGKTKEELHQVLADVQEYLKDNLNLRLKDNYQIFPSFVRGVDFVGYRIFKDFTLLRKTTCLQMEKKMTKLLNKVQSGQQMNYSEWCSINSYKGWLKHCDSFRLSQKYIAPLQPYADEYYIKNIKSKKKKGQVITDERLGNGQSIKAA